MKNHPRSAIERVVEHHGSLAALSRALGGKPAYQELQRWVSRKYASPKYIHRLEPFLPQGIKVRDLLDDFERGLAKKAAQAKKAARAEKEPA